MSTIVYVDVSPIDVIPLFGFGACFFSGEISEKKVSDCFSNDTYVVYTSYGRDNKMIFESKSIVIRSVFT